MVNNYIKNETGKILINNEKEIGVGCFCYHMLMEINKENTNNFTNNTMFKILVRSSDSNSQCTNLFLSNSKYNTKICFCSDLKECENILLIKQNGEVFKGNKLIYQNENLSFENITLTLIFELDFEKQIITIFNKNHENIVNLDFPLGYIKEIESKRMKSVISGRDLNFQDINNGYAPYFFGISSCDLDLNEEVVCNLI